MAIKVLVVDDDDDVRREVAEYLTDSGYEVTEAADGLDALAKFQSMDADALVTDLKMPRLGGEELCRRVREIDAGFPIIVITGHYSSENADRAYRAGAAAVFEKPMSLRELLEALQSLIGI